MTLRVSVSDLVREFPSLQPAGVLTDGVIEGVEFDSRKVRGGELFIALPGEHQHGQHFVSEALSRGAAYTVVEDATLFRTHPYCDRILVAADALLFFGELAAWWRRRLALPVLGITGSVGKTTVKDMCASILLQRSLGAYSQKSFNNQTGVPYTLCQLSQEHRWLVCEMGMNAPREMTYITEIARPDVAVITEVALAHLEAFNSVEDIGRAKLEIVSGLPENGPLIVPRNHPVLGPLLRGSNDGRAVLFFDDAPGADCWVEAKGVSPKLRSEFVLHMGSESIDISISLLGAHNVKNAACAALASRTLIAETSLEEIKRGLETVRPATLRLERRELQNGSVIIDDSYNANPASMRAAFQVLQSLPGGAETQKIGLILGDMLELGERSAELHHEIGEEAAKLTPHFIIAVGNYAKNLVAAADRQGIPSFTCESPDAAAHTAIRLGFDRVLVKGSRGIGLDRTVQLLIEKIGLKPPEGFESFRYTS